MKNSSNKMLYVNDNSEEIVIPISRFLTASVASDTVVNLYFDSHLEGEVGEAAYSNVAITTSSDAEDVLKSILGAFASSRDSVLDLTKIHSKISSVEVTQGTFAGGTTGTYTAVITPSGDGSVATPTKTLTAADSGKVFFPNIGTSTVVVQLPAVKAGLKFDFILPSASNNEATKDFAIITSATDVDFYVIQHHNGVAGTVLTSTVVELTGSTLQMDTSVTNAAATMGDKISLWSDGTAWYGTLDQVYNNAAVNANHVLA